MKSISIGNNIPFANNHLIGTVEILLAFSLAGSSIVVAKLLSLRVPVFTTGVLSLIVAFICMLPVQWTKRREIKRLNRREIGLMLLQALCGIVLFRIFTLYGLRYTSAADASIITAATPAVMALLSVLLLKERLRFNVMLGVLAALGALVMINLGSLKPGELSGSFFGNLLIFCAVVSEVLLTIFRRFTKAGISSITNTTLLSLFSILMMFPVALVELQTFDLLQMTIQDWLAILYYGAVATAAAYILWGDGALRIPAAYTGVACVSMPITALLLSSFVLGETLTSMHLVGCVLAVTGILCCNLNFISPGKMGSIKAGKFQRNETI
ncbi:DMT family transporter [bacterium]|nr:DMT family transporter [bacterium]